MSEHVFAGLDGGPRQEKPRGYGLTMVIDWGMGLNAQQDLLAVGADYFDLAKVAVGVSRLLAEGVLRRKLETYQSSGVEPFPGGQFLEYAEMRGKADAYLPAAAAAGYRWMEVSDNLAPVELSWKQQMIRRAVDEFDMKVLGEVGKKEGLQKGAAMVDDAEACLDAGADIVLLEAAELVDPATADEVEAVVRLVGEKQVMFELPGPWIDGVHECDIHRMRRSLIDRYGEDVNLGNVDPGELISVEAYRRRLGVNAGGADQTVQ